MANVLHAMPELRRLVPAYMLAANVKLQGQGRLWHLAIAICSGAAIEYDNEANNIFLMRIQMEISIKFCVQ